MQKTQTRSTQAVESPGYIARLSPEVGWRPCSRGAASSSAGVQSMVQEHGCIAATYQKFAAAQRTMAVVAVAVLGAVAELLCNSQNTLEMTCHRL